MAARLQRQLIALEISDSAMREAETRVQRAGSPARTKLSVDSNRARLSLEQIEAHDCVRTLRGQRRCHHC